MAYKDNKNKNWDQNDNGDSWSRKKEDDSWSSKRNDDSWSSKRNDDSWSTKRDESTKYSRQNNDRGFSYQKRNDNDSWSTKRRTDSDISRWNDPYSTKSYRNDDSKRFRSNNNSRDRYSIGSSGYGSRSSSANYDSWNSSRGPTKTLIENPPVEFKKEFITDFKMSDVEAAEFRVENHMIVKGNDIPPPFTSFDEVDIFPQQVHEAFKKAKYSKPTPIQAQGWSMALSGKNMVGIAQTGSGKTLSFVLPALIHANDQEKLRQGDGPIDLVLARTRELVIQIEEVFQTYKV